MDVESAQRVLVCLRYGIGDVVMQTPALDALRSALPTARITALGAQPAIQLLENDPRVDRLVSIQDWGLHHWGDTGTLQIKQAIKAWLGQQAFDVILDPYHATIAVRDVLREQQITILDTVKEVEDQALGERVSGVAAIHAATLKAWGLKASSEAVPRLCLHAEELRFAEQFLSDHGLEQEAHVAICPVTSSALKCWPVARFAAVADRISKAGKRHLLLFCGPRDSGAELLARMEHTDRVVRVESMHLRRIAALVSRCAVLVGNDTGVMHIAAAVNVPVVAIFGPTSPAIYLPPGATAVGANIECRYRKNAQFGPPECVVIDRCLMGRRSCIDGVRVDDVAAAVSFGPRCVCETPGLSVIYGDSSPLRRIHDAEQIARAQPHP